MKNIRIGFLVVCALLATSCSISDRWVHEDIEGVVPDSFFSTVKKNKTQQSWLVDNLGQPHLVSTGPRNEEVFSYRFKRTRYREANFLFIFRLNSSEHDVEHYHVVFCDNVVRKAWWDTLPDVQVSKISRWSGCRKKPSMAGDQNIEKDEMPEDHMAMKQDRTMMKTEAVQGAVAEPVVTTITLKSLDMSDKPNMANKKSMTKSNEHSDMSESKEKMAQP